MLWKEVTLGFLIAGFIGLLGNDFFNGLFIRHAPAGVRLAENAIVGPIVAMLSFVCSVGNAPVAAVLWSGGIGFGGVIAFVFADLIVLPIIQVYRKYYGGAFAMRITALMFVTIVIAALIVDVVFSGLGLVPQVRPTRSEIFGAVKLDYRMVTNGLGVAVFAGLFALTALRGATDPVCGMKVDRSKAIKLELGSRTLHFCSEHCLHRFQAQAGASGAEDLAHRGDR
jgi:YHS domain-containing protein